MERQAPDTRHQAPYIPDTCFVCVTVRSRHLELTISWCENSGCFPPKVSETTAWSPIVWLSPKWSTTTDRSDFTAPSPIPSTHYLDMWLDLMTTHRQTRLFSSTSTCHSTDLLTTHGVAHLVVHRTSGSTIYETIPPVRLETSVGVLSTVDMVVQWSDGPRWLRDDDEFRSRLCFLNLSLTSRPVLHLLTKFTLPACRMAAQPLISICCPCLTSPANLPGATAAAVKWWERQMDLWTVDMWTT